MQVPWNEGGREILSLTSSS